MSLLIDGQSCPGTIDQGTTHTINVSDLPNPPYNIGFYVDNQQIGIPYIVGVGFTYNFPEPTGGHTYIIMVNGGSEGCGIQIQGTQPPPATGSSNMWLYLGIAAVAAVLLLGKK